MHELPSPAGWQFFMAAARGGDMPFSAGKEEPFMMHVTIGVLAHVDAGKTTLSEQLLCRCGVLRACGRVDRGDTCLDFAPVERQRGVTVFSAQADLIRQDVRFFLLDTPGHPDFSPEMERCLAALDYGLLVVSAVDGVQAHTEILWRMLQERRIPVICFLNKLDSAAAEPERAMESLRLRLGAELLDLRGGMTDEAREQVAMTDDRVLEAYLAGGLSEPACWEAAAAAVGRRQLLPVFGGSALSGDGVEALLDGLCRLCRTGYRAEGDARSAGLSGAPRRPGGPGGVCQGPIRHPPPAPEPGRGEDP